MLLLKLLYNKLFRDKPSGLLRSPYDVRDFTTGFFGWGDYKPKHKVWVTQPLSVRHQNFNTCQWHATITQKEPDENTQLSVRKFVTWARRNGYIKGDGFSDLRSGQLALQKYGAEPSMSDGDEGERNWDTYSNVSVNLVEGAKHKINSFWSVTSKNDIYKLLDLNRILTTGLDWYNGFNQSGGFSYPWLIDRIIGFSIGGHAVAIVGYEMGYKGKNVLIIQNSYGKLWGDTRSFTLDDGRVVTLSGIFYIDIGYFLKDNYGIWTNLDTEVDYAKFITKYDNMNVKGSSPTIWHIQGGQKKVYPDWLSYLAWNGLSYGFKQITKEEETQLSVIPEGDYMDIKKTIYWEFLKNLESPDNLNKLIEILHKK